MSDTDGHVDDAALTDLPLWNDREAQVQLQAVCEKYKIPIDVITELVSLQRERQHQERAAGIFRRFEEILGRVD